MPALPDSVRISLRSRVNDPGPGCYALRHMRYWFAVVLLVVSLSGHAQRLTLTAEQWAGVRGVEGVVGLPGLADLLAAFERQPDGALVVYHASHDRAAARAETLRAWLVALGVPSARIALERAPAAAESLVIEVRAHGMSR